MTEISARSVTSADDVAIYYERHGSGELALVFVHGWACDGTFWRRQVPAFAGDYEVLVMDIAGHGRSGAGRERYTTEAFAADVAAVAGTAEADATVLVGHSLAGPIVVAAAEKLGPSAVGVIWVDTLWDPEAAATKAEIAAQMRPFREDSAAATDAFVRTMFTPSSDPALVRDTVSSMSAISPDIAIAALSQQMRETHALRASLSRRRVPIHVINTRDFWPTDVAALERYGVRVQLVSSVGHFLMLEAPEVLNAAMRRALADIPPEGTGR